MIKKQRHEAHVQKSGNIVRTVAIWLGLLLAIVALGTLLFVDGSEKAVVGMVLVGMVAYGFSLLDFDVDDDD